MPDSDRDELPASKFRWIFAACLVVSGISGGVAYGLSEQTAYEQKAYQDANNYAKDAADKVYQSCGVGSAIKQANCIRDAIPEYKLDTRKQRHDADDLVAQQRSALWTSIMGIAALIGMALSAIGVILIWTTFREQRRATDLAHAEAERARSASVESDRLANAALETATRNAVSASRAAASSSEGNALAREAMRRQLRPYVYVEGLHIEIGHMMSVQALSDEATISVVIKNYGESPAKCVSLFVKCSMGDAWDQRPDPDISDAERIYFSDMPKGAPREKGGFKINGLKNAHFAIENGLRSIFVEGKINYTDAFGEHYYSNFQRAIAGKHYYADGARPAITPHWNDAN